MQSVEQQRRDVIQYITAGLHSSKHYQHYVDRVNSMTDTQISQLAEKIKQFELTHI